VSVNTAVVEDSAMPASPDGLVRINHAELVHKLRLRGKPPAALRKAGISFDTLAKIKRGEPVQNRILEKISVQLAKWPVLEHATDLVEKDED